MSEEVVQVQPEQPEQPHIDPKYVTQLEREYKELTKKLQDLQDKLRAYEEKDASEQEKLSRRLAEAEAERHELAAELQTARLQLAVQKEAGALGIDPELAYRLISPAEVEYDERGRPTNVGKLLRDLVSRYPHLAGGQPSVANVGRAGGPAVIRASQLRDRRFWEANKALVFQALAEGRFINDE